MQSRIAGANAFQRCIPFLARQLEDFIQRGLDALPFGR